jgi:small-conductance mechanosensitive channel
VAPITALLLLSFVDLRAKLVSDWISREAHLGLRTLIFAAVAWLLLRLVRIFVWQRRQHNLQGAAAPALMQLVVNLVVISLAAAAIAHFVFDLPVTGFWATSSVLGLVLGIALQRIIADFFSGIALELDPPFRIGDYIEVRKPGMEPIVGQVTEIRWRATQIRPRGDVSTIHIPNSDLSALSIVNIYSPLSQSRFETLLTFDLGVPVSRVRRIVMTSAQSIDAILKSPPPELLVNRFSNAGIEYKIRYWLGPQTSPDITRHELLANIAHQLRRTGLHTAAERRDTILSRRHDETRDPERIDWQLLARNPFFAPADQAQLEQLAANVHAQRVKPEKTLVHLGESGQSMFLVGEGLLEVFIEGPGKEMLKAGEIATGDVFGEISLLTGAPRNATVVTVTEAIVYEIMREDIQELLGARPEVAEHLSHIAAKRQLKDEAIRQSASKDVQPPLPAQHHLASEILAKMRVLLDYL